MSFTSSYVMAGIGTFFILFWLFLYIKYRNAYDQVIDAIDKKKFMFGEIYFIGFGFITLFHINIKTERGSKKIKEISEIYGRKYAEFYHYVITGGSISYFLTLLPMGFCLGAIANNVMLGVLGVVASALLLEYMSGEIKKNVNERREDILEDLPQMLSKFTLLINAGLIVRDAWFKVAYANDKPIYKEMQEACVEMNNGVPIVQTVLKIALALAESAYDLNQLCLGKSVPLYKSSTTWAMSPQGMINVTKETAATLIGKATEAAEKNLNDAITNVFDKIENTANDKISEIGDTIGIYMTQTIRDVSDKVINATVTPFMNGIKGVLGKIDSSWGKDKIKEELQNCLDKLKEGSTDDIYGQAKTVAIEYLEGKIDEVAGTICDGLKDAAGNKSDIIGKVNALFKKVDPETNTETGYIVDLNDQIAKKITDLSGELQGKVSEALNSTEDNVKEELNEALNNFSDGISEKVSSGLDKVGESAPDSKTVGDVSNAKAATISLNYKEYLYAFMLIGILANEDNMVARTGYLMQMNISQKMTDAGFNDSDRENFDMTKMYTMVQIHSEADVDSVFMGMFEKKTVNGEESYSLNFDGDGSSTDRLVYNGFIGY